MISPTGLPVATTSLAIPAGDSGRVVEVMRQGASRALADVRGDVGTPYVDVLR
jgi:hypothetical protein